jgi:signal recognition particle receptor subunit beta
VSDDREIKIIFTGPMGAGKTTAIRAISDKPPVSTEVANTDQARVAKATTTVAMDYGQMVLEDGTAVNLYGTPGQERFSFMWEILCRGALGVVLLIDGSTTTALADLQTYAEAFRKFNAQQPFVIGVGRVPEDDPGLDEYARALAARGIVAPVFGVDVRKRDDVLLLIDTLLCVLEAHTFEAANAAH